MGRARWLLLSLIALAALGAAWFYNFYVSSTDSAIRHAEASHFRRMTSAQLAEQGAYRFFYATNRNAEPMGERIGDGFGNERDALSQRVLLDWRGEVGTFKLELK
jgi:hypothetical protein